MHSKGIILVVSLLLSIGCFACNGNKTKLGPKAEYHSASKELLRTISQSNDRQVIEKSAKNVAELAIPVIKGLVESNSTCANLANFIQSKKSAMYEMKPSEIEVGYHEGKALPKFPDDCHDLKELIVHPATVVSLAKFSPDLAKAKGQMKDEIEEVLAHFEAL